MPRKVVCHAIFFRFREYCNFLFYVLLSVERKVYAGILLNQTLQLYNELGDFVNKKLIGM